MADKFTKEENAFGDFQEEMDNFLNAKDDFTKLKIQVGIYNQIFEGLETGWIKDKKLTPKEKVIYTDTLSKVYKHILDCNKLIQKTPGNNAQDATKLISDLKKPKNQEIGILQKKKNVDKQTSQELDSSLQQNADKPKENNPKEKQPIQNADKPKENNPKGFFANLFDKIKQNIIDPLFLQKKKNVDKQTSQKLDSNLQQNADEPKENKSQEKKPKGFFANLWHKIKKNPIKSLLLGALALTSPAGAVIASLALTGAAVKARIDSNKEQKAFKLKQEKLSNQPKQQKPKRSINKNYSFSYSKKPLPTPSQTPTSAIGQSKVQGR